MEKRLMTVFEATMIAEGVDEADEATTLQAWQLLVDTGTAWQLQGFFGRTATALIEQGLIKAPKKTQKLPAGNHRLVQAFK